MEDSDELALVENEGLYDEVVRTRGDTASVDGTIFTFRYYLNQATTTS